MPALDSYDYALIRVVPRVERGEAINAGVVLYCRTRRFLAARVHLDPARLLVLDPTCSPDEIGRHLAVIPIIAAGDPAGGPIARLPQDARFHWLVAPRSTIIQPTPIHSGLTADPERELEELLQRLVM